MSRVYFLSQLPAKMVTGIAQDVPPELILDGDPVEEKPDKFLRDYPHLSEVFSSIELSYMKDMYQQPMGVPRTRLRRHNLPRFDDTYTINSNTVDVHIKNIRKKIAAHNLSFRVRTSRSGVLRHDGAYILEEIK